MSFYNMMFGVNPYASALLASLGLTKEAVPRFRDVTVKVGEGGGEIHLLTRTGGGNRADYQGSNSRLAAHPLYLWDADEDFDSTYATFAFRLPPELAHLTEALATDESPMARLEALIQALQRDGLGALSGPQRAAAEYLAARLKEVVG